MKDWYWTNNGRYEDYQRDYMPLFRISRTMNRLGLSMNAYPYNPLCNPTLSEMLAGFLSLHMFSLTFFEKRFGITHNYYDGHHCSIWLGIINIHWSY